MAANQYTTNHTQSSADAVSCGLDLDSSLNDFTVSFSTSSQFSYDRHNSYAIHLSKDWKDDMGLHLLQRTMLPQRNLKCVITLKGHLRITEDYGGAMKQSVKMHLTELVLDKLNTTSADSVSGADYTIQMKLADPTRNFSLEDNFDSFDRRKFMIGGPAIQEVKARGFQLAELLPTNTETNSTSFEPIISKCRFLRITVKNWQAITNSEVFSPEITSMIGNASGSSSIFMKRTQEPVNDKKDMPLSEQSTNYIPKPASDTKRPCSCWKRDECGNLDKVIGGIDNSSVKHSDACESDWAALFGDYVQETKLKQVRAGSGGIMASRWASGA